MKGGDESCEYFKVGDNNPDLYTYPFIKDKIKKENGFIVYYENNIAIIFTEDEYDSTKITNIKYNNQEIHNKKELKICYKDNIITQMNIEDYY